MALGHSLACRTGLGRLRPGMGPAADDAEMSGYSGVGYVTNGIDARAMDPRGVARLRVKYATEVEALKRKVSALTKENTELKARMLST